MKKAERVQKIREILEEIYPDVRCTLNYSNPLEMLIATQLSAQCTDARVNIITKELFKRFRTVEDYANAELPELESYIRSAGFYTTKAKNIKACCQRLIAEYNGQVPDTMEDLLTLPGTGRKTANLVLGDIFKKPAVVVDTHCIRLTNRLGLTKESDPTKIEFELKKLLPPDYQLKFCHQMVHHGRVCCTARKPKCTECALFAVCKNPEITQKGKKSQKIYTNNLYNGRNNKNGKLFIL